MANKDLDSAGLNSGQHNGHVYPWCTLMVHHVADASCEQKHVTWTLLAKALLNCCWQNTSDWGPTKWTPIAALHMFVYTDHAKVSMHARKQHDTFLC